MAQNDEQTSLSRLWFETNIVDDKDEMLTIGKMAKNALYSEFLIHFPFDGTPISIFAQIYDAIISYLKSQQSTKDSVSIELGKRLEIGYTTTFMDENAEELEKLGNSMVYLKYIDNSAKMHFDSSDGGTVERCTKWAEANITTSLDAHKEITRIATKNLEKNLSMIIGQPSVIMPIFMTVFDHMIDFCKISYPEQKEFQYKINMAGCFEVCVMETEDGLDISLKPSVSDKVRMKDDGSFSSKFD